MLRAQVLAAGLGTRLRPLTYEIPKPMVPVLDRPVMAHIVDLLHRHGVKDVIANLHYFPDTIRDYFGDGLTYRYEEELLGTAGGVRNCADFLTAEGGPFLIISGDALTDIDLTRFLERHKAAGGIATLAVKRVADTREYGVVIHDADGRISGFQEKPDPAEALSDLGNCGMYLFEPEIFDYFPEADPVDWAHDVFPALLSNDVPFYVHEIDEYWNDVGSLDELRQGTFDALTGELHLEVQGEAMAEGLVVADGSEFEGVELIEPPVWIGHDVRIGKNARLQGPLVIGDEAVIGEGANLKESIVFPGTDVADGAILIGAIAGHIGITESLRRPGE
jgi:mannose-1-phosphate guanylyltransferase/mannose-1-phosphate guanylyltransferase/phosphomannomutase